MIRTGKIRLLFLLLIPIVIVNIYGLAAPRWQPLDKLSVHLPTVVRRSIARNAVDGIFLYGYTDKTSGMQQAQRTLVLDPENPTAWEYIGEMEQDSKPCDAQLAFEKSVHYERVKEQSIYMSAVKNRNIGETALQCGHLEAAYDALNRSKALYERAALDTTDPEMLKKDVMFSHDYLSVYWSRVGNPSKAKTECQLANPQYTEVCVCRIDSGETGCSAQ